MTCDRACVNHDIITICSSVIKQVFRYIFIVKSCRAAHGGLGIRLLSIIKSAQNLLRKANVIVLFLGSLFKIVLCQVIAEKGTWIASILSTAVDQLANLIRGDRTIVLASSSFFSYL